MKQHKVQSGDCISSIAARYGFSVDALWNDSNNSSLKEKRKDPNMLVPGDVVAIPDLKEKQVSCETAKTHRFKLSAPSVILRLQLFEDEKAQASLDFELKVPSKTITGKTDDQGVLEVAIPCDATEGVLTIGPDKEVYELRFGYLQPPSEKAGVADRLKNLGFTDDDLTVAVRAFQKRFGLTESGDADQATLDKLSEIHDTVGTYPAESSN